MAQPACFSTTLYLLTGGMNPYTEAIAECQRPSFLRALSGAGQGRMKYR
jgi:hypothetical protein